jgi:2-keto-4-pentenoate hydratase/2-oxohepta-3-ene-1,7-dioic acid hydratase in catechol pathway
VDDVARARAADRALALARPKTGVPWRFGQAVVNRAYVRSCQEAAHRFDLWLDVNGQRRQTGNTGTMIVGIGEIIRYLSPLTVLDPGDTNTPGTPPGVALGMADTPCLWAGDVVELGISGLGRQRQRFMAAP